MIVEAMKDARSVILSINSGRNNAIAMNGETVFWQREEWVRWALDEVLPVLEQAIAEAEKQEPVAFASHGVVNWIADKQFQHEADLYTHPQPKRECNFCERCGKRLFDGIHTCTPPLENA